MEQSILIALIVLATMSNAKAVSLNGRTQDDSVCDLSPYTTDRLSQRTFVAAGTPDLEEIYARLAMRFIVGACRTGQILILHTDDGSRYEDRYFTEVATRLCGTSMIEREAIPTVEEPHAFRIKCRIIHLKAAADWLRSSEKSQSTETLITKGTRPARKDETNDDDKASASKTRCDRGITFGALLGISGGCTD